MLTDDVIDDLKSFNWDQVIGMDLDDLNDAQWRFLKGLVVELTLEKNSGNNGLVYVGDVHKDFDWPKHNLTVELKSQLSGEMYLKRGGLAKNFGIKLNNSNGTNKKNTLSASDVADILIVVRSDGAFVIDKDTVLKYAKKGGDGFEVKVHKDHITEITGRVNIAEKTKPNFKDMVVDAIRKTI